MAFTAFCRMLLSPINALKDIIAIMLYEITPDIVTKNGLKWACRLCLTLPPAAPPIMPLGQPGVLRLKEKMLLFLHLTKVNNPPPPPQMGVNGSIIAAPQPEPLSVVIPIVYDIQNNQTTVA